MSVRPPGEIPPITSASWALDLLDEGAIVLSRQLHVLVYNRAAVGFFGSPPSTERFSEWEIACGFHLEDEAGSAVRSHVEDLPWHRILRGNGPVDTEYFVKNEQHPSGIWVKMKAQAQLDAGGAIAATSISIRDISVRHLAELSRNHWETRLTEFMRFLPGVAFIKDASGKYLFFSESSLESTGLKAGDVIGKTDDEIWSSGFANEWRTNDREVLSSGKALRASESIPTSTGVRQWTVYKFPIPNERGELALVGGIGVDDNERLQLEARLQQAEKMEAIGRLAGGIAHDFNNLLTVISGYGQMLQEALERDVPADQMKPYLDELLNAGTRAVSLTDQLLAFSRRKVTRPRLLDLREHVQEVERVVSRVIGEQIEVILEQAPDPCYIQADPGQLTQVILNLAIHAKDSIPKGGRLKIRTAADEQPPFGLLSARSVTLEFSEIGVLIEKEIVAHIFEPFFTRKSHGQGTGLGLPTVYGIVRQMGGEIVVTSDPQDGTVFRIYLPASGESISKHEKPAEPRASRTTPKGHETILLVEDDANVRNLVRTMLESFGYRPLVADDGRIALHIFQQHRADIHLLLTDVIMPQMSGRELAMRLRQSDPNLKILYMSGYTADEIAVQGLVNAKSILLQKPFDADSLARRVREVLDSPVRPN